MTISLQEFIEGCKLGLDIEFEYNGKAYTVLAWVDEGIEIGEQHNEDNYQTFPTADAVLDGFLIDGIPLRNIITKVQRTL